MSGECLSSSMVRANFAKSILSANAPGAGEMKKRISEFDWSKTELGPIENFSISLLSTISMILSSQFPMAFYWGPNYIAFYNDAYVPLLGAKHPRALGSSAKQIWEEIWPIVKPAIENCYNGIAMFSENALLFVERSGYLEEAYFTYSFGPIMSESGKIEGMLIPSVETTKQVIAERRLHTLSEVATQTNKAMTLQDACQICANVFDKCSIDIPFSLIYLIDSQSKNRLLLQATSGYSQSLCNQIPFEIDLQTQYSTNRFEYMLQHTLQAKGIVQIKNSIELVGIIPNQVHLAVAIRINSQETAGILIVGINTKRAFDEDYQTFVELLANQLSKAIASAQSYEYEKRRVEELAKLDEAKTVFFTNISHEFRTPLTLMLSGLEEIENERTVLSLPKQDTLSMISRNSKRLLKLVNTLLDFSRIEAGRIDMCFTPTDIVEYTRLLANLFESTIRKEGLEFHFVADSIDEKVYVDTSMWEKIIMNLVSNAFKFTFQGKIEIRVEKDVNSNHLKVQIIDSGVGIEESEIANLFTRFYRVPGTKGRSFEGSGIGLALVQELVKYHSGTIHVQSELGKGTTVTVTIPLGVNHLPSDKVKHEPTTASEVGEFFLDEMRQWMTDEPVTHTPSIDTGKQAPIATDSTNQSLQKSRILVVDDNADMRNYLKRILSPLFEVHVSCDGSEASNLVLKDHFDLILSDVMMPKMDGFELVKFLRSRDETRFIPVILLSARAGEESTVEGLQCGANDYLVKTSFSAKELITRVQVHLELSKLRMNLKQQVKEKEVMLDQLEKTKQTQEEFIDMVCHEIRNPLAGILGSSEVIQETTSACIKLLEEEDATQLQNFVKNNISSITNCIQSIQECVMHQTMIANDVLSLSKIDAGKFEIINNQELIAPLIQSSIGLFTSQLNDKQLRIISDIPQNLIVEIDGRKYKQIVINFISNAIKFSSQGKRIWLSVEYLKNEGVLKTTVKDEGRGMSVEEQKHIFQRFSQVNQSIGNKYEGFGLGLAICNKLVKLFGGNIIVQSAKEEGTCFVFAFPCKATLPQQTSSNSKMDSLRPQNTAIRLEKPVLIVEDNEINQKILKRILNNKGISCEVANNGREAVDMFSPNKYALIFMDVIMPEMNGLDATRAIRKIEAEHLQSANVPIVGLSGNAKQEHQNAAMETGMNDYIIKPVLSETVLSILRKYCK